MPYNLNQLVKKILPEKQQVDMSFLLFTKANAGTSLGHVIALTIWNLWTQCKRCSEFIMKQVIPRSFKSRGKWWWLALLKNLDDHCNQIGPTFAHLIDSKKLLEFQFEWLGGLVEYKGHQHKSNNKKTSTRKRKVLHFSAL